MPFWVSIAGSLKNAIGKKRNPTCKTIARSLVTRQRMASGLMAKAGQTKILLGNVTEQEAVIMINKQTIKVAAGTGTKAPDGPTLELAPGTYKYSSKAAGKAAKDAELKVGKDEIWGLMIGPGGVLEMQMY